MTLKKPKRSLHEKQKREHHPDYQGKGERLAYQPMDLAEGIRNALEVLRTRGRVTRCEHNGDVYYKFNGKPISSIEIMRLAGMTREVGR